MTQLQKKNCGLENGDVAEKMLYKTYETNVTNTKKNRNKKSLIPTGVVAMAQWAGDVTRANPNGVEHRKMKLESKINLSYYTFCSVCVQLFVAVVQFVCLSIFCALPIKPDQIPSTKQP